MCSVLVALGGVYPRVVLAQDDLGSRSEVQLSMINVGVGGLAREGDWAGLHIQVLDQGSESRDLILRVTIPDEDGDDTEYDRVVTSNPGMAQSYWLYSWIPFQFSNNDFVVRVFEAKDTGDSSVGEFGFKAGKLVGQLKVYNPQLQAPSLGFAGIIGSNQLGLDQYGFASNGNHSTPFGHELFRNASGLTVSDLPDRWQGLVSFDLLVWSSTEVSDTSPLRLSPEKARAIKNWVNHGGHLVIVLPSSGDPWFATDHPLYELLPMIKKPHRIEGVDLEGYRSLITQSADVRLPDNSVVYTFEPRDDAGNLDAIPILNNPAGDPVVIRRSLGAGMVSVVGMPMNHGLLRRFGLPEVESFWHRVLGRRGEYVRFEQMTQEEQHASERRKKRLFDDGVVSEIAKTGRAVQGILFGVVVFALYWLIAGPVGYAVLKSKSLKKHAWVAFVGTTTIFTACAWFGATMLRPKSVDINHLTMLEQVHGSEFQRTRSWLSVMLPRYGRSVVSLTDPSLEGSFRVEGSSHLISPWNSPDGGGAFTDGFPDNSGYRVESREPSALRVPTRATTKTLMTQWGGTGSWSMPTPVGEPGAIGDPELSLDGTVVSGQLIHDLPGQIQDLKFFIVSRITPILTPGRELKRQMISRVSVISPRFASDGWGPGEILDMEEVTRLNADNKATLTNNYFASSVRYGVDGLALTQTVGGLTDRLVASRFISQMEPPRYNAAVGDPVGDSQAIRRMLHGWDLGQWMNQRVLIMTGVVDIDSDDSLIEGLPYPVWVDGDRVESSGKTIVTWIYPFESQAPLYSGAGASSGRPQTPTDPNE